MACINVELDSSAEKEFYQIVEHYGQFGKSLVYDFIQEFDDAILRIIKYPNAGHPHLHKTQRVLLNRFPYSIVYKLYPSQKIVVFAIMHLKRKPDYWKKRLK